MMTIILTNDLLAMQLPQACIMIRTSGDQVSRISTKSAVPNPALMATKRALELEWLGVRLGRLTWLRNHLVEVFDFPDLGGVVG